MTTGDEPGPTVRTDGGRDEGDDETNEFGDEVETVDAIDAIDEGRGGFLSRLFPGRDPTVRALKRRLKEAKQENQRLNQQLRELRDRVEELEGANAALEETKEGYEQRQFAMGALLESVGRSFEQASDELADHGVTVGDLDITLHADVSGGGHRDTLDLRLVDPDEEIDPKRLSTISFSVGRRGRLRHYGQQGAQAAGGGADGPRASGTPPTSEEPEGDDEAAESDADAERQTPTDGPTEVPNVSGLDAEEATQELTEAGFEVHTENRPDEKPVGTVVEQWPRAFSVAPRGSSVVLFVGGEER